VEGGASTEPRGPGLVRRGGELERGRASGLAPESGSRLPHSKAFGGLVRRGAAVGLWGEGRVGDRRAGWRGRDDGASGKEGQGGELRGRA
jgi:hypothetical protein